jgi:tetratricopeptide (TPR) repeat protein
LTPSEPIRYVSDEIQHQLEALAERAEAAFNAEDYARAAELYLKAFHLLPEPRYEWPQGEILLDGASLAMLAAGDGQGVLDLLSDGLEAPVTNSPLINLRIGQAFLVIDDEDTAANHFLFALLGGGRAVFETEDPAFYQFATERIRPPEGCATWDVYEPPEQWPPDDVSEWFDLKPTQ